MDSTYKGNPIIMAADMTPGHTYEGTADGPAELDGVTFTVFATVSFDPGGMPPHLLDHDDVGALVQVMYDAYGFPFPEVTTFAPGDVVVVKSVAEFGIVA